MRCVIRKAQRQEGHGPLFLIARLLLMITMVWLWTGAHALAIAPEEPGGNAYVDDAVYILLLLVAGCSIIIWGYRKHKKFLYIIAVVPIAVSGYLAYHTILTIRDEGRISVMKAHLNLIGIAQEDYYFEFNKVYARDIKILQKYIVKNLGTRSYPKEISPKIRWSIVRADEKGWTAMVYHADHDQGLIYSSDGSYIGGFDQRIPNPARLDPDLPAWHWRMETEFYRAWWYDYSKDQSNEEKARIWRSFLSTFTQDNPRITRDDEMRAEVRQNLATYSRSAD